MALKAIDVHAHFGTREMAMATMKFRKEILAYYLKTEVTEQQALDMCSTDEQMAQANGGLTLWTRFVIPANTYPGQDKPINTIAQPNFLAVRDDVDEEAVYKIVKTIYENLPFLQNIHKATKAMKLENAIAGLPVPLHPGAARYYREQGIEIPDSLIANHKATKAMKLENAIAGLPVSLDPGAAR